MLKIPYISSPKKACALACYTMVAKHFFPATTFNQISGIVDWEPGYLTWAFKFWKWIMDKGVYVEDYDLIDMQSWADGRVEGLKSSVSEKEFNYYQSHTKSLEELSQYIPEVLYHKNFSYHREKPTWDKLENAIKENKICEVVLDSHTLDDKEGFALHRVIVLDITADSVIFHDPRPEPRPERKENIALFKKAWLEKVSEPELCVYWKTNG